MKLVYYPDPILNKELKDFDFEEVKQIFEDAADLKSQMVDVMVKRKGIGLSACQVGLDMRCFVMGESKDTAIMVINPKVLEFDNDTELEVEGCLSFPDVFLHVKRPKTVQAEWLDENGEKQSGLLEGYGARCFMHELDHLNGVVYKDHVSRMKYDRALTKKAKITKQRNKMLATMQWVDNVNKLREEQMIETAKNNKLDLSTSED
jgi:peptide deformylase